MENIIPTKIDDAQPSRVALETDALEVWLNGVKIETESGFTEDGSEMTFQIGNRQARIIGEQNKRFFPH